MDRAVAFYEAIGFEVEAYHHGGYAFVRGDGISIDLSVTDDYDPLTMAGMAYLTVDDPDATYEQIVATGLVSLGWEATGARITPVEDKEWGMREFALADPDNNLIRVGRAISTPLDQR